MTRFPVAAVALLVAGCSYYTVKHPAATTAPVAPIDGSTLSYQKIRDDIFSPKCFSCHTPATGSSGSLNLDAYATVIPKVAKIRNRATELKDMPLGGPPLPADLTAELAAWIDAGAPETAKSP